METESLVSTLRVVLRVVTILGLVATDVMVTAILYLKLKKYYPEETAKFKWAFYLGGSLLAIFLIFIYYKLYEAPSF